MRTTYFIIGFHMQTPVSSSVNATFRMEDIADMVLIG